ncbi:lactate racemase domain-containing protein [Streptomyces sp. NPDC088812]|uniref:lactate racemase domain-containing protein n=1 Tax=Streptomyces sp. NPDC088812 TaxID=3365905 RepID=UPI003804943F
MTTHLTPTPGGAGPRPAARIGSPDEILTEERLRRFVGEQLAGEDLDGRRVCLVVPDGTRSCPLPLLLSALHAALHGRVSRLTVLIALGTHAPMAEPELAAHLGYREGHLEQTYPGMTVVNHEWWEPGTFTSVGAIPADRVAELSGGRLRQDVDVRLNRAVVEADVALVVGPVFPHEVVGFSGGNKYFFPGVAGPEIIDVSHWLGALITSAEIIGTRGITPVRALIDEASALIPSRRRALCVVVRSGTGDLHAAAYGAPEDAWSAAADVSAETHVRYLDAPVRRVLSLMPAKYDDIWTAAKGFYKLEPVVADGGEVILYAPHVSRISEMHPEIEQVGYHCRDYFTGQWDRFKDLHWGVLAHSTHLRGAGTWDPENGERCRVTVTLATGIPEDVVRAANLNHLDPAEVDAAAFAADPDTLVVPEAGEVLYRLRRPGAGGDR